MHACVLKPRFRGIIRIYKAFQWELYCQHISGFGSSMCQCLYWRVWQLLKVESSCRRLGLTALSYLWQRDQAELLQEMVDCEVNAVLIKVAGIGLKPHHLGQSLAQMQPILQSLVSVISNRKISKYLSSISMHSLALIYAGKGGNMRLLLWTAPHSQRR